MIKIIELFAGVGSQTQALKNLGVPHEVVVISEIDRFAIASYEALHGTVNNLGDITKIDQLPKADLWTYSFPCQDISVAGNGAGLTKGSGTRSGLLWEVERLLLQAQKDGRLPKYLLLENVKNLIGKNHKGNYESWIAFLSALGYTTYTKVLNAKHYGVPQNRERIFGVSILGPHEPYQFPDPVPLTLRLKDILEDEVDKKFYLSESTIKSILSSNFNSRRKSIHDVGGVSRTLAARQYKEPPSVVVAGTIDEGKWGKVTEMHQRVYSPDGIAPTITSGGGGNQEKKIILDDFYPGRVRVFDDAAPTIRAGREGLKVVAMRGRNPDNPSDRTAGVPTKQRLEAREDDCTNCITTVQKDNMIMYNQYNNSEIGDIAPTQTATCGNVTSSAAVLQIKTATKLGYETAEDGDSINTAFPDSKTRRGRVGKQIAQTIETSPHQAIFQNCTIRKLTPTECWRLMGWDDEQIEKVAAAGISNSQRYKIAGNGIVLQVLMAIFKNLFMAEGST